MAATYSKCPEYRALFSACKYLTVAAPRFVVRVHEFVAEGHKWRAGFPRFVADRIRGRQCQGSRTKGRMRGSRRVGRVSKHPRQGLTESLNTPATYAHAHREKFLLNWKEGSDILKGKDFWKRSALMIRRETDFTSDQELIRYDYCISSDSPSITRV